ncbi:hypothetical protein O988_02217 [Pseudogymnoascus sp. VKM F-3808]|nr:hypothetical protein O988_02217 [Pseudogymnoascus sp. VKM F-3808]
MAIQVVQRSPATVFLRGRKLFLEFELDQVSGFEEIFKTLSPSSSDIEAVPHESDGLVQSLFEKQAKKTPDAISVQFENQDELTYRQLNEAANGVARQLSWARNTIVPIAVSRSINLVIALLAVLKAGAAYVLLSTDSPAERNRFIINDTKALFVITDATTEGSFKPSQEASIEDLVAVSQGMSAKYLTNINNYQDPSDTAYVIYTSGTTGHPKGVILPHSAAHAGISALPDLDPSQPFRQLLCHSPIFSAAQRTILGALCRGGTLCLASKENITLYLSDTIEEMGISSLEITPSMLKLIDASNMPSAIKRITLGGEAVGPELVETWAGKVELISAYGLSECTQLNMRHHLKPGHSARTIGMPSDSTTYVVLAPNTLNRVPPTTPGELCLGGNQLGKGYLNLPEKSREVFINNPYGPGRLYRTGDMVIENDDGTIELIGRIDQQTKIDGQRVEPSESNFIIQVQPGVVQSCVVSAVILNRNTLVGVIVPEKGRDWASLIREIRLELRALLPHYAIPRYWVRSEELPLTPSGKVDISSLQKAVEIMDADKLIKLSITRSMLTPQSSHASLRLLEAEEKLDLDFDANIAKAIADALSISPDAVDFSVSFQEIGGSSLDAIVVASNLRKMNIHISVSDILQSESIRQMLDCQTEPKAEATSRPVPFSLLPQGAKINLAGLEDAYPVTPLQEGILGDSILGSVNYVYQRTYKLQGVSSSQVQSAMNEVLAHSSILRTIFFPHKRSFVQAVKKSAEIPWTVVKGASLDSVMRESSKEEMPLDESLIRVTVIDEEVLLLEMHHSLFDFWSSQFVIQDTMAVLQGKSMISRLPFSSYVAFQQRTHDEKAKEFWRGYLQSATATVVDLGVSAQATEPFVLKSTIGNGLAEYNQNYGITMGAFIHAAWALTLASMLNTRDVTFVAAFLGRDADLDGILSLDGPTLNTVPMRVQVDETLQAVDFAKSVQSNLWILSKFAHSGMRNALTEGSLKPSAFNTMVNILVKQDDSLAGGPLVPIVTHGDNFTQYITIEISETDPTSVKMLVPFAGDLLSAETLLGRFVQIVGGMIGNPEGVASQMSNEISPVDEDTTEDITRPVTSFPQFGLAHAAFESFAASTPSKTAIRTASGEMLSYAELNGKANSFAAWLISEGVQHGEIIPLYMEKSTETLISILGIIKAGASFTPLDPLNPHDRNAFIVKDVEAKRIVTDEHNKSACASFGVEMIITEDMELPSDTQQNPVIPDLTPESVIYAIYTSGSTGLPKGVLVQHSAVTASTEGMIEATAVTSDWNALWVLNYVFDASYYDVFTIFSAGATLCLAPQDELLSNLASYINELEIEQVMLTPTITKLISGGPEEVPGLKVLNVCGEKIDVNILHWAESVDVYNGYGPTEATILMTVSHIKPDGSLNSIGYPLKHVTATIVSPEAGDLEPVPRGTVGELCVRGPQLAKGYLNRPEQTAAAFVRDIDGEPLYRTGDLARWADDGSLECLGRKDYQIKLNGFRIELGEIENAILVTEEVDAAIVSVAEVHGKRQLVAFCIFKGDHLSNNTEMPPADEYLDRISSLSSRLTTLSHYMVPSLFLPFRSFPTLPSGKANRKALIAVAERMTNAEITTYLPRDNGSDEFVAATTEEELIMRQAWASVLDEPEESIGASSIFLSLGGDSISAINVVAACRKLSYNISVSHILSNPTLGEQAKNLKTAQKKKVVAEVKYETPKSLLLAMGNAGIDFHQYVEEVYPCGAGQIEFLTQGHKKQQFWNLTACRELPPHFDLHLWKDTTRELTARNQILRTMYFQADQNDESSWYQIIVREPFMDFEHVFYATDAEKLGHMESLRDGLFTFGRPNIKYRLLQSLTDGTRTLCIKVDHGSYDGTLLRIFDDQFRAIARGDTNIPPVNSFKKFIDWAHGVDRSEALRYWKRSLHSYTPGHNLPLQPISGRLKFAVVNADVDSTAAAFGVTASTVFQAAYSIVAGKLTGANDVLVDNLLTGRNADVESPQTLNGACANFLPFRSKLSSKESIAKFLKDTQAQFWDTTEHGAVGLHDVYKTLNRDRQVHSAKLLYCFQPFEPAPATAKPDPMRWIVMAQSKVFMTINYALMVEVQKTAKGHRFKLQWDSKALNDDQADKFAKLFSAVLTMMGEKKDGRLAELMGIETDLEALWKA